MSVAALAAPLSDEPIKCTFGHLFADVRCVRHVPGALGAWHTCKVASVTNCILAVVHLFLPLRQTLFVSLQGITAVKFGSALPGGVIFRVLVRVMCVPGAFPAVARPLRLRHFFFTILQKMPQYRNTVPSPCGTGMYVANVTTLLYYKP